MASNYVQPGETLTLIAPAGGVVAGLGYVIGSIFAVALVTAAAGQPFTARTEGVFRMAKATGAGKNFTAGEAIFWDNSANKRWDKTATGFFQIGVAVADAAIGDTTVLVEINMRALAAV